MPRTPKVGSPRSKALAWWKRRADAHRYVVDASEIPTAQMAGVLRHERLIHQVAGKRIVILKAPEVIDDVALFVANYWPVVVRVLAQYEPAAITGVDAVRLHLGEFAVPVNLTAQHAANRSRYDLLLDAEFVLRLRPTGGNKTVLRAATTTLEGPSGAELPVLAQAHLLMTLDEDEIKRDVATVAAWLRHLVLPQPTLEAALEIGARPIILQRLADIAGRVGNASLERQLDRAARAHSTARATPNVTGVGTRIVVPEVLQQIPVGTGTPWTDAQQTRLARQVAEVDALLSTSWANPPVFKRRDLLAHARAAKAYDAYHSTTMEGYRISRKTSDAIVAGRPHIGPRTEEEMKAAMAVKGYAYAFDRVLELSATKAPVDGNMILDLYQELFRPSVDAGFVEASQLRGWRTWNVSLRGYRYVPPNHLKLRDLLAGLDVFAATTPARPVARAMLVHLEFVTVHPFGDGNGRLGRLLMNLELLRAGLPWVTVRADERQPFFVAIQRAQVEDDVTEFAHMMEHLMQQAAKDLATRISEKAKR